MVLAGEREASGWWGEGRPAVWADAVQVVREVARVLRVDVEVVQAAPRALAPRPVRASSGSAVSGSGTPASCTPPVCQAYGVPARTCAVEVDLDAADPAGAGRRARRRALLDVPGRQGGRRAGRRPRPARRPCSPTTLREGAGPLLESVRLFDVYSRPQIGEGKKSLAFALRFRAPDRTLTEAETGAARDAAVALAAERHGAVQRS